MVLLDFNFCVIKCITKIDRFTDDLRRKVWPLLLEVDPNPSERAPLLTELSDHPEYNQVILDVNRSLKRFPPGNDVLNKACSV